jgi:hypothetical protein
MLSNTLRTRGLHAGVRFAPPATLDKQHKQRFQLRCSEGFDWRKEEYGEQAWALQSPQSEGDPRSQLKLTLQREVVNFEDIFPTGSLEVFNDNVKLALAAVADVFNPRLILASGVIIRLTTQAEGGDARLFLANRALNLETRLSPLGRPVHAVGLKFLLPPLPGENQPNWQAEVKVESLVEDVRQLFIEVDAKWGNPIAWNVDEVVTRVCTTHDFATRQVIEFLEQFD